MRQWINLITELRNPPEIKKFADRFDSPNINSDVQGKAARGNPMWKIGLISYLKKYGFREVGAGINGAVFQNPDYPFVLKIYRDDTAYDEWLYFCRTHAGNPYVPVVKGKTIRINGIFSAVRLEPLMACSNVVANGLITKMEDEIQRATWKDRTPEWWAAQDRALVEVSDFIERWAEEGHADLTPHNIMKRADGHPVIIDPLYFNPEADEKLGDW